MKTDQATHATPQALGSTEGLGVVVEREWTAADEAWVEQMFAEQEAQFRDDAADKAAMAKWLRKMRRTHRRCTNCTGGIDGESDGMGGFIGGRCQACDGTGWVLKTPNPASPRASTEGD